MSSTAVASGDKTAFISFLSVDIYLRVRFPFFKSSFKILRMCSFRLFGGGECCRTKAKESLQQNTWLFFQWATATIKFTSLEISTSSFKRKIPLDEEKNKGKISARSKSKIKVDCIDQKRLIKNGGREKRRKAWDKKKDRRVPKQVWMKKSFLQAWGPRGLVARPKAIMWCKAKGLIPRAEPLLAPSSPLTARVSVPKHPGVR